MGTSGNIIETKTNMVKVEDTVEGLAGMIERGRLSLPEKHRGYPDP